MRVCFGIVVMKICYGMRIAIIVVIVIVVIVGTNFKLLWYWNGL